MGIVAEETTEYMIVDPVANENDAAFDGKVKIEYEQIHSDFIYGKGRKVIIYFDKEPTINSDGLTVIKTDDISTDGFRDFELEAVNSDENLKKIVLTGEEMRDFVSFGHMSDTDLYYYGLDDVMITIKEHKMPLDDALRQGKITLNGIIAKCNNDVADGITEELSYDDGGSSVYKYPGYTIIKYHTLDGNRDVYIGRCDMDINVQYIR